MTTSTDIYLKTLQEYFGHKDFRPGQKEIIKSILDGYHTMVVMPTGGGKSICYQLPAVLSKGITIVISPLIALMKDQVDALNRINIPSTFINSSIFADELNQRMNDAIEGKYKLLYIAPERLENQKFLNQLQFLNISLIAVDEAHCISEWGHDFRPAYLNISKILELLPDIPIIALTATATSEVQDDIVKTLKMLKVNRFIRGFDRPNLQYITEIDFNKVNKAVEYTTKAEPGSTIVYCGTRKRVEYFADEFRKRKIRAIVYHAGLDDMTRKKVQEEFIYGKIPFIVATNAFGMGIDKSNVRNVFHFDYTGTLEAYYQEAGRAGRDGNPSQCVFLYHPKEKNLQHFFIKSSHPEKEIIESVYDAIYDAAEARVGEKPVKPVMLNENEIASLALVSDAEASSCIKLFHKLGILFKGSTQGLASVNITTSRERIVEYYRNSTEANKQVIEAIMRSVGSDAYNKPVQFDFQNMLIKYGLSIEQVKKTARNLEMSRLLTLHPPGISGGLTLISERAPLNRIPVDFEEINHRREIALKKFSVVVRYTETHDCKRNFILQYFRETDINGTCGKCTGCIKPISITVRKTKKEEYLTKSLLIAIKALNGKFGKGIVNDFVAGRINEKIKSWKLQNSEYFGLVKEYSKTEIGEMIDIMFHEGLISYSADIYPTMQLTNIGDKQLGMNILPVLATYTNKYTTVSDKLYKDMDQLRQAIAQSRKVVARSIISDMTLKNISSAMPVTKDELKVIRGVGSTFISNFGEDFLNLIRKYKINKTINEQKTTTADKQDVDLINAMKTFNSLEEISKALKLKAPDTAMRIQKAIEQGMEVDLSKFIGKTEYFSIKKIIMKKPKALLKDIRASLDTDIELPVLRIAVAWARKEINKN